MKQVMKCMLPLEMVCRILFVLDNCIYSCFMVTNKSVPPILPTSQVFLQEAMWFITIKKKKKKQTHIHIYTCNSRTRNVELYAIFVPQRMFDICKHGGCAHSCVLSARAGLEPAGEKGIVPFLSVGGRFVALR